MKDDDYDEIPVPEVFMFTWNPQTHKIDYRPADV